MDGDGEDWEDFEDFEDVEMDVEDYEMNEDGASNEILTSGENLDIKGKNLEDLDTKEKNLEDWDEADFKRLSLPDVEACLLCYTLYANAKHFGVRKKATDRSKSKTSREVIGLRLVCNREGERSLKNKENRERVRKARDETRCKCPAGIWFKFRKESESWVVSNFVSEHSHELVDTEHVPFLKGLGLNGIDEEHLNQLKIFMESGISPVAMMRTFIVEEGGHESVGFPMKRVYNELNKIQKEEVKDGDAETVMAYLTGKYDSDPDMFLRHTRDEEGRLDKMYWADGKCVRDYFNFGAVIGFDATYKCNSYNKPFIMIVGINEHRKTVPFGCALVSNETEETYIWVLQQMLEAGGFRKPSCVITDGDRAMAGAIAKVLPKAVHRLCLWHLLRNVKANGGTKFCSGFMKCVDRCRTSEEFEQAWKELTTHYKVENEKWVADLYKDKKKWSEAFLKGHFFAGMRSTQRCEVFNRIVKTRLNKKIMLYRFVRLYDTILVRLRHEGKGLDYKTKNSTPVIKGPLADIKRYAARIYTRNSYDMLCKEMEYEASFLVMSTEEDLGHQDGHVKCFTLSDVTKVGVEYQVIYAIGLKQMFCSCLKLESIGYPCRHMFAVMKQERMTEIPDGCVLTRWTVHADVKGAEDDSKAEGSQSEQQEMGRQRKLSSLANKICKAASKSSQMYNNVFSVFQKLSISIPKGDAEKPHKKAKLGIKDPKVLRAKGSKKTNKDEMLEDWDFDEENHNDFGEKQAVRPEREKRARSIDLNLTPSPPGSPASPPNGDTEYVPRFPMLHMPRTYEAGEASQAQRCYEVEMLNLKPLVCDWHPQGNW